MIKKIVWQKELSLKIYSLIISTSYFLVKITLAIIQSNQCFLHVKISGYIWKRKCRKINLFRLTNGELLTISGLAKVAIFTITHVRDGCGEPTMINHYLLRQSGKCICGVLNDLLCQLKISQAKPMLAVVFINSWDRIQIFIIVFKMV